MHSHPDRYIASCDVCQKRIKEIEEAGKELARLGVWNMPKKIKKGATYIVWKRK
jgi:hypothetical protein